MNKDLMGLHPPERYVGIGVGRNQHAQTVSILFRLCDFCDQIATRVVGFEQLCGHHAALRYPDA